MKTCLKIVLFLSLTLLNMHAEDLRIEPSILAKNLKSYTLLDTRDTEAFSKDHIQGALNFPINLTYDDQSINGKISSPKNTTIIVRNLGLDIDMPIVIYDEGNFFDSARLFWTLEVYGFKNLKILNTSFNEWKKNQYPVSSSIETPKPSSYVTAINTKRLATKFTTQIATKSPNHLIIDARDNASYVGEQSSAKRFGHIPSAHNIPASHNIDYHNIDASLKSIDELKELYKDVDKTKKIVIYCAAGRVSSTNYFALRELGHDVANYDSSWKEWGNDFTLPIIGPKK